MLARLQQALAASLWLAAAAWAWYAWPRGPLVALAGAAALLLAHAWVLAFEFVLLARVRPGAGLPKPGAWQMLRAWWGEVWTGAQVFGWRQPFRANAEPDHLPAAAQGRRGVLLVHGFVCNRGLWAPWMRRLRAAGVPHMAITLEPVFGSIDRYVPAIDAAMARLAAATGRPPLVVAHSMGGLAVRAWAAHTANADVRMHGVVTLGTPHLGTRLAALGLTTNARQMRPGNAWLQALAAREPAERYRRFSCVLSHCDNIVFPAELAALPGAHRLHLPGVAHVHLAFQPEVWALVQARLAEPGR